MSRKNSNSHRRKRFLSIICDESDASQLGVATAKLSTPLGRFDFEAGVTLRDDGANGDNDGYEVSAQYKFEQWTFVGVYNYATGNDGDDDAVDNFALEGVYKFNSNLRTYVGYKFEQIDNQDDQLQAGIRYDF